MHPKVTRTRQKRGTKIEHGPKTHPKWRERTAERKLRKVVTDLGKRAERAFQVLSPPRSELELQVHEATGPRNDYVKVPIRAKKYDDCEDPRERTHEESHGKKRPKRRTNDDERVRIF